MQIKSYIPNFITLFNLFSGCVALIFAFQMDFEMAFYWICIGIFFDFFDGFFARILKVQSELGLQLDSLADMVTSGVVPGIVMYLMMRGVVESTILYDNDYSYYLPFLGFIITLGSCYRLAKFNVDTRQTSSFIGLPTPANALFILSLPLVLNKTDYGFIIEGLNSFWVLLILTVLSAFMLNAEIPLFSLKIKNFDLKAYGIQILFLLISLPLLLFCNVLGVPLLIISYVLLSIIMNSFQKKSTSKKNLPMR